MSTYPRSPFDIVEGFWQQLAEVDDRLLHAARRSEARRRRRRTLALAALLLLALAAIGLAAMALFGSDAPRQFQTPRRLGQGSIRPGSSRLLAVREADPVGGPPWGLRVFVTTKDRECFQTGRVVEGRLVALGIDGAFANDGKAHALPLEGEQCSGVRKGSAPRFAGISAVETRSGVADQHACLAPQAEAVLVRAPAAIRDYIAAARLRGDPEAVREGERKLRQAIRAAQRAPRACSAGSLRWVIMGAAGPGARFVTLRTAASAHRTRTTGGVLGAYLFVLIGAAPAAVELDAVYADGQTCPLPSPLRRDVRPGRESGPCLEKHRNQAK